MNFTSIKKEICTLASTTKVERVTDEAPSLHHQVLALELVLSC